MKLSAPKNSANNWKFTRPDLNSYQKFTPMVTINFYEDEDRKLTLFKPLPVRGNSFSRNILYPFYVYGGSN